MLLLNVVALVGLSALTVPVLLHLQKRRKAKEIAWSAMRFLTRSLAARRRGLTLEHLLLLFCRCLIVAAFVLALARPVMPSFSLRPLLMMVLGTGAVFAIAFAVVWPARAGKVGAAVTAVALLCATAWTRERSEHGPLGGNENCDLAIVLDGTTSMTVAANGKTPFENAVTEAAALVDQLSGKSTVSVVLAGPVSQVFDDSPFHNLARARTALGRLKPSGGGGNLQDALSRARALLERGSNENKQLVVFSDNQLTTWQLAADSSAPATDIDAGNTPSQSVRVVGRLAKLPTDVDNLAVVSVRVDAALPSTQAPLPIEVEVLNGGSVTVHRRSLKLLLDERQVASQPIPQLEPGARATLRFAQTIPSPGAHVISGVILEPDLVTADNRLDSVVTVISQALVLVVDGNPHADLAEHSATFASLSLDPSSLRTPDAQRAGENATPDKPRPIRVERVDALGLTKIEKLERFQIVLLCETADLPEEVATRLSRFVHEGGGLWLIPGSGIETEFHNRWSRPGSGERFLPAKLGSVVAASQESPDANRNSGLGIDLNAVAQSGLSSLVQRGEHDLAELSVLSYRKVEPNPTATVALRLTNGDPLMLEQAVGRGRVVLQTLSLNRRESNLISLVTFPVLMHLWVQRLASSDVDDFNFRASPQLIVELRNGSPKSTAGEGDTLKLTTPHGDTRVVSVSRTGSRQIADIGFVAAPGVYRIRWGDETVPFTVQRDARESEMAAASERQLKQVGERLGIEWIDSPDELRAIQRRTLNGRELWKCLLYATLCLLAVEIVLARWVTLRRSPGSVETKPSAAPQVAS